MAPPSAAAGPTSITLNGHGFGHGRGLGQYGAKGYAEDKGWSAARILDHFYGGTTAGTRDPSQLLSVLLCDLEGVTICTTGPGITQITVTSAAPFHFEGVQNAFEANTAIRITYDATPGHVGFIVERATGGCTPGTYLPVGEGFTGDPVIDLDPGTAMLQVCAPKARTYRGNLKVAINNAKARVVNVVTIEQYLRGVVPAEMPSSWHAEALKSQAVAARSYALAGDNRFPTLAQTCDTIQCQVYLGFGHEQATTNAAIEATAGQVRLMSDGNVARTEFSSSTGGHTAPGAFPAVVDEGDATAANPYHNWTATIQATQIESAYPTIGDFLGIEVLERNGLGAHGGRVKRVRVRGADANVEVTGDGLRSNLGLRSDWFTPGIAFDRVTGADRFETAANIAKGAFTTSSVALLVRGDGDSFPDGLAANYIGGVAQAPTLLATQTTLPPVTLAALKSLEVSTVHLLGGPAALSVEVETALTTEGFAVVRTAGADRFETAAAAAATSPSVIGQIGGKKAAVLSSGTSFPDALAAGGIVWAAHLPQLLTLPGSLPASTSAALTNLAIKHVIITGGTVAVSTAVEDAVKALGITVQRAAGATRYETAVALADLAINTMGFSAGHVDIATGESFPDALVAGSHTGKRLGTLILTQRGTAVAPACSFLSRRGASLTAGHIFGGTAAVADATKAGLENCTRG